MECSLIYRFNSQSAHMAGEITNLFSLHMEKCVSLTLGSKINKRSFEGKWAKMTKNI